MAAILIGVWPNGLHRLSPCQGGRYHRGVADDPAPYTTPHVTGDKLKLCDSKRKFADVFKQPMHDDLRFGWQNWTYVVPGEPACSDADYDAWCKTTFASRSLLFVGDSIMEQQYVSLLSLLRTIEGPAPAQPALLPNGAEAGHGEGAPHHVCGGRASIGFVRNDYVCEHGWAAECSMRAAGGNNRRRFTNVARGYDTLIINAGLHSLPAERVAVHATALARWLNTTRHTVIWRTGVPGHAGCQNASAPRPRSPDADGSPVHGSYGWSSVEANDELRASIFDNLLGPTRVHYLDAASVSSERADRHLLFRPKHNVSGRPYTIFDCLHYCLPGPPDDWNRVLRAILLKQQHQDQPTDGSRGTTIRE
jgi:hypothetical protein